MRRYKEVPWQRGTSGMRPNRVRGGRWALWGRSLCRGRSGRWTGAAGRVSRMRSGLFAAGLALLVMVSPWEVRAAEVSARRASETLRRAAEFYRGQVSREGGYHFLYSEDLTYGRSEQAKGLSQVTVQRAGTPLVGMAYLTAYHATGEKFYLEAARDTARALVRGQYCSGGWDYIIEFDPEKRKQYPYRADNDCEASGAAGKAGAGKTGEGKAGAASGRPRSSTLDDNVSQAALRLLMRVDHTLKFRDEKIHEAALFALESLMKVQYPNGAWPQKFAEPPDPERFPVRAASYPESWERKWPGPDYRGHYTFNDNSLSDMIDAMLEASRIYDEPRYQASAEKGGDFMLLAQMPEPQPGWAQQYDVEMHPAWARIFEPPSITGGESQGILKTLLLLYRETGKKKYLEPIPRALAYYRKLRLPTSGDVSAYRSRACPEGSVCMARFYELKTDRPLYITKGTRVNVRGKSSSLLGGYELSYSDASVITHYGVITRGEGFEQAEAEYARVTAASPATLKRPVRLSGLSPWSAAGGTEVSPSQQELASAAAEAIQTLDKRGVWIEKGSVDRGDRVLQFFAAKDMVVTIGDRQHRLKENEYLRIYPGEKPPAENLIRSSTFARNVTALSEYLASQRR